jgi:long-chain acyl-CoA synthetase
MASFKTLTEMLKESVEKYSEKPAFKIKEKGRFAPVSFRDFLERVRCLGTGLLDIGIKEFDHIGLVSENRFEWILCDMAIIHLRAVDVPCSGASSPRDIFFKLSHSDSNAVILEGEKQFVNFLNIPGELPNIKNIILLDRINLFSLPEDAPGWAEAIPFQENNQAQPTKKFEKAVMDLIKCNNTFLFLSPEANIFFKKYLNNNKNLLSKAHAVYGTDNIDILIEKLEPRILVIDKLFNQINPVSIYSFREVFDRGKKLLENGDRRLDQISAHIKEDDLVTIIYTSGTTADPKGVMLIHSNFIHNVKAMPPVQYINENDRFLSVLPSWHIFERTAEYLSLTVGASTAYSKPFKQVLLPDLLLEKPTIIASVPRIWESVYQGAVAKAQKGSSIQKRIFDWSFEIGKKYKKSERTVNNTLPLFDRLEFGPEEINDAKKIMNQNRWKYKIADKLVYSKIRALTGGELRFAISGGGALPEKIDTFFDVVGILVCEGYGLTETSPVISARNPNESILSTVGVPMPEAILKVVDKDNLDREMPHGEIGIVLTQGPMVMKGYYKNEETTSQAIQNNWFNTGDLGRKTKNGKYLQLVGRSKDTIVLRGGENVEPQPLEDKLLESAYIQMAVVVGQDKPRLGVLIVPNFNSLKAFWEKEKIIIENFSESLKEPRIISLFQQEVKRLISRENGFSFYETVMGVALCAKEFSIETGELTETLKIKRFEIHKKFAEIINKICG